MSADDPYAVSPAQEARGGAGDGDRADADAEAHPDFYSVWDDGAGSVPAGYRRGVPYQKIYRKRDFAADGKNGFIYRKSVARDARLKQIIPTEKAEKLRMDILVNIQEMEKKLTGGIPKEDLEVCLRVLRKMICNLSEEEQIKWITSGGRDEQKAF